MNKVLLEKLRKIIKNVSCNSLKCVYQHQLEEWLEIDSDECSKFIRELVEENLIEEKYDFQCECGNDCTVYHRLLLTEDFQCSECERKYNKDDIKSKAEVLYEIDKQAVMDYKEEYTAINSQIRSFVEYKRNVRQDEIRQIDYEAIGVERQVKKPRVFLSYSHKDEEYKKEFANKVFASENSAGDRVMLIEDNGEALAERIRMLEHAKQSIVLSTFDFHSDISGKKMLAALWAAAERGVKVKILADGCNSWLRMTGNAYFYALASHENVTIKTYNPVNPLLPFRAMSRMHDKYVIVDDSLYLLGGRNVYDSFLGAQDGPKNYDRDVLVYHEGEKEGSLYQVKAYFEAIWNDSLCKTWNDNHLLWLIPGVKRAGQELEKQYISLKKQEPGWFQTISYQEKTVAANRITLLSNPTCLYSKEPQVFYGLCELMKQAKKEVIWHTPYIINNDYMYGEIAKIAKEVPEFTIMTNSVKNNGNPFGSVDYALHKDEVLKMGAKVLEYHGGVSYHGKSAVIDDRLAIVGSFNMDMKSAYQDTELMLVIDSRPLCEILKKSFTSYQEEADAADGTVDSKEELFDDTTGVLKKVSNYVISKLNPYLRYLF